MYTILLKLLYINKLFSGNELMDQLELSPKSEGYYDNYNASVDASIANNFATASFRFAHSLLPVRT